MAIAEDAEMLTLTSKSQNGQPIPNMLFATVHYLLLQSPHLCGDFLLSRYDGILQNLKRLTTPHFLAFCRGHRNEITALLKTRCVQTNVIKRCSYLFPSFCCIYNHAEKHPSRGFGIYLGLKTPRYRNKNIAP